MNLKKINKNAPGNVTTNFEIIPIGIIIKISPLNSNPSNDNLLLFTFKP